MTIPRNIHKEHIVKAIDEANRQPWPSKRSARTHHLLHDGRLYPVKYIISLANKYAGGGELPSGAFISTESRVLLERLGFPIISQRPVAATPESPAETNTFSINDKTVYIRNTAKPSGRDAFRPLGPDKIGAPYNSGLIGTNRTRAYMDAYGFIFAAMSDGPMPCIGDKAVTNCLIGAGYLVYDAATHTLHPGAGLPRNPTGQARHGSKTGAIVQAICEETISGKKIDHQPAGSTAGSPAHQDDNASVAQDIEKILIDKAIDATSRQTLIDARIGQGKFRRDVMARWEGSCAFSGCITQAVLRASHIKPWRDCSDKERLDPANGLLLSANFDALFDRGLISFGNDGRILISPQLSDGERSLFNLGDGQLRGNLDIKTQNYLAYHRKKFIGV